MEVIKLSKRCQKDDKNYFKKMFKFSGTMQQCKKVGIQKELREK